VKLNVTTTPQSVFPDGHQDAITVTNTGTSDLYLDRTTAVSPTESLKLVPGSYIIWNAGAPLYLLSSHASGEAPTPESSFKYSTFQENPGFGRVGYSPDASSTWKLTPPYSGSKAT
jgi:hypothetical protein